MCKVLAGMDTGEEFGVRGASPEDEMSEAFKG